MSQFLKLADVRGTYVGRGRKLYHVSYLQDFADAPSLWSVAADSLFEAYAFALAEHQCDPESLLRDLLLSEGHGLDGYEIGEILNDQAPTPAPAASQRFTVIALRSSSEIRAIEVTARDTLSAFAAAAVEHEDVEFVAALPSWVFANNLAEFPGSAIVDSSTVIDQPDVFGASVQQ